MSREGRPAGTVAFLFTDVEGSTQLWESRPADMEVALALHDQILRDAISEHGGYVFSTAGDAFAAAFDSVLDAIRAAVRAQERSTTTNWPNDLELKARMGVHVGQPTERQGDYFGPVLNRAARLMSAGHGGQTLVSAAAAELARSDYGDVLVDLGQHRLKDLAAPEHVYQVGAGRFAPLRTLDRVAHNLPEQRTPLFGRAEEIRAVVAAAADEHLVTLTGIGGLGKTRLALAAAAELAEDFPDGVWFVDLVPVSESPRVPVAVAEAAGLVLSAGQPPLEALMARMQPRRMLLVLDNCEHLIEAVADVVDALLDQCPGVQVLATSREPLDVEGELVHPVSALSTEGEAPAVSLFLQGAARAGTRVPEGELDVVRSICEHLDGLPLAIELAAAQLVHLTPGQLADRLNERFDLLTTARRGRGRRQSSLVDVLRSNYGLLNADQKELLQGLGSFGSSFELDAAEGVGQLIGVASPVTALRELVRRSLVTVAEHGRYRLLETVKLFVRRLWSEGSDPDRFLDAHLRWFASHVDAVPMGEQLTSVAFAAWYLRNYEDVRAAARHAAGRGDVDQAARMLASGGLCWHCSGDARVVDFLAEIDNVRQLGVSEPALVARLHVAGTYAAMGARAAGRIWVEAEAATRAAEQAGDRVLLGLAMTFASWRPALNNPHAALVLIDRAEELLAGASDDAYTFCRIFRANHEAVRGDLTAARVVLRALAGCCADHTYSSFSAPMLTATVDLLDDPELARTAADERYRRANELGFRAWIEPVFAALAAAANADWPTVDNMLDEAIDRARRTGIDDGLPDMLLVPAVAAFATGDEKGAAQLIGTIHRSQRPTYAFPCTIVFRELRRRVGSREPDTDVDLAAAFAMARAWLKARASDRPSRPLHAVGLREPGTEARAAGLP